MLDIDTTHGSNFGVISTPVPTVGQISSSYVDILETSRHIACQADITSASVCDLVQALCDSPFTESSCGIHVARYTICLVLLSL